MRGSDLLAVKDGIIPYSDNIAKHKNKNPYLKIKFYKIVYDKYLANKNFCFIL